MTIILLLTATVVFAGCSSEGSTTEEADAAQPTESTTQTESSGGQLEGQELVLSGSTTLLQVSEAWASAFMEEYGGSIIVNGGGSGGGIADMINGLNDLANASRQIKEEEIQAARDAGYDPVEHTVLYDGIAVIVSDNVTVDDLTIEQLSKIYRAEITNWSEVGGPDAQIVITARDTSSGTGEYFLEAVVQMDKTLEEDYSPNALRLQSNADIVNQVKGNDNAIGYIGLGYLEDNLKVIKIEAVAPSVDTVKDGTYPVSRGLYVYAPSSDISKIAQAYMDFVFSEQGQQIGMEEGFVPID
ncbi:MAG: PstS family phosphate ABC transporter substrate-binding protein [Actinomycetia bacterium]|nr:PstS family phosphate ABC transporter substrate-binding protein [Actinomycetes bacterium]